LASPGSGPSHQGGAIGLYHLAWEVDTLTELGLIHEKMKKTGIPTQASDHGSTKALYASDPDGIEFEVCWLVPDYAVEESS
jgi:catechol-2,3-dioxygenase